MVPGEAEGERDSHTEGEKGKTLNNDASKSFLYNFFLFYFVSEKMADSTSLNWSRDFSELSLEVCLGIFIIPPFSKVINQWS